MRMTHIPSRWTEEQGGCDSCPGQRERPRTRSKSVRDKLKLRAVRMLQVYIVFILYIHETRKRRKNFSLFQASVQTPEPEDFQLVRFARAPSPSLPLLSFTTCVIVVSHPPLPWHTGKCASFSFSSLFVLFFSPFLFSSLFFLFFLFLPPSASVTHTHVHSCHCQSPPSPLPCPPRLRSIRTSSRESPEWQGFIKVSFLRLFLLLLSLLLLFFSGAVFVGVRCGVVSVCV